MHRLRRGGALLGAALSTVALVSGCTVAPRGDAPPDTLTYATDSQPDCLDPQVSPYDVTALIDRNIFDSLVSSTPSGQIRPWLARSWTVSPDGLSYRFALRTDVRFHDGTPFDAAAVKTTLDRTVDPATRSVYASSLIKSYAGSTVVDPATVEVRLRRPDATFLTALSTAYLGIQSPTALRADPGGQCLRPVGSGPFRFVSWSKNVRVVMTRNDDYAWPPPTARHAGPPALGGLTVQFIPEDSVRFGALASGQVDVIGGVPASKVATLRASDGLTLARAEAPGAGYSMYLNSGGTGPLSDERVRIAVQRSIRIDELVDSIYFHQIQRAWSPLGPSTVGYDPSLRGSWPYDPQLAARLLDEAGWTGRDAEGYRTRDGVRLTLRWPFTQVLVREQRGTLAQGIQSELKRAGIDAEYYPLDTGAYIDTVLGRKADILTVSFQRSDPDILRYLFASDQTSAGGGSNFFGLSDPVLDGWLAAGRATSDPGERARLYSLVQHRLVDRGLVVPLYTPASMVGISSRVRGVGFDPQSYPSFYEASTTGVNPA